MRTPLKMARSRGGRKNSPKGTPEIDFPLEVVVKTNPKRLQALDAK
jgi:hypothetical protein